ncbi:Gtpase activating protein [Coemansia brasiliensis]|uniref:Gtpase activating protein n=1 Tax=Coemansia brasiliensis TaxID=2650707 RepID=A0A9W8I7Y6_9FUNG|nr:Gtpase activating protein [Coemansia brasiliensis]
MVTATDKEKKRLADKHRKILTELSKQHDNSTCADCGATGARWASWNLGVFLCIRCGGLHRHLGTHITKIKSISLDNWTTEQIEHFRNIGNKRANAYFNPHPDRHPPPRSDRDVERFIRDKYQHRLFVDRHNGVPDPSIIGASPAPNPVASTAQVDEASALTRLHELGFVNVRENHQALQKCNMDVEKAIKYLRGESTDISLKDPRVAQLLNMGFSSASQNAQALTMCQGDVNHAIELLLSNNPPPRSSVTSPAPSAKAAVSPPAKAPPKSPANDLLDGDFFGSEAAPATKAPAGGINELLGGLSLSEKSKPTGVSAVQESNDLFGDFGDFLSAGPQTQQPQTAPATANPAATASNSRPVSPPQHGGQSMLDTNFIMSLYSKPNAPASTNTENTTATAGNTNKNANSGFNDLDFFM